MFSSFKKAIDRFKYRHGWKALFSLQENMYQLIGGKRISGEDLKSELNLMRDCTLEVHMINYSRENKWWNDYNVKQDIASGGDAARDALENIICDEIERKFGKEAAAEFGRRPDGIRGMLKWVKKHDEMLCINMTYPTDKILASYTAFIRKV